MKALIPALFLIGCSAHASAMAPASPQSLPPVDNEMVLEDYQPTPVKPREIDLVAEDAAIIEQIQTEYLQLRMCGEVYGVNGAKCVAMKREFCETEPVNSAGRLVHKPFCVPNANP
jgi:hypothetical protein